MRRCSRPIHGSLTELNVTPLLDLGFVLLVIFLLTTTPVINDLGLSLPKATADAAEPQPRQHTITLDPQGRCYVDRQLVTPDRLAAELERLRSDDPKLVLVVRGDARTPYREILRLLDALRLANISAVELAADPRARSNP
ncbi:MAG: biopolymer transporter ExbD [Verrucomicrobiales bacterium]|nr:biopolymer transporter ExbD [Verrucomicrobiales bacterium]